MFILSLVPQVGVVGEAVDVRHRLVPGQVRLFPQQKFPSNGRCRTSGHLEHVRWGAGEGSGASSTTIGRRRTFKTDDDADVFSFKPTTQFRSLLRFRFQSHVGKYFV